MSDNEPMSVTLHTGMRKLKHNDQEIYIAMVVLAIGKLNHNRGSLRREIWAYILKHFNVESYLSYQTFLTALSNMIKDGKLKVSEPGIFRIEDAVYRDFHVKQLNGINHFFKEQSYYD